MVELSEEMLAHKVRCVAFGAAFRSVADAWLLRLARHIAWIVNRYHRVNHLLA